jgi:hypothetical protein
MDELTMATLTPTRIKSLIADWQARGTDDATIATALEQISAVANKLGLADPTRSDLLAGWWRSIMPPRGWKADEIELWKRLPYALALAVTKRREQDIKAVRALQNKKELAA